MSTPHLSFNTRKALTVHLGDSAGSEVAQLIQTLVDRIDELEQTKVTITPVAPNNSRKLAMAGRRAA